MRPGNCVSALRSTDHQAPSFLLTEVGYKEAQLYMNNLSKYANDVLLSVAAVACHPCVYPGPSLVYIIHGVFPPPSHPQPQPHAHNQNTKIESDHVARITRSGVETRRSLHLVGASLVEDLFKVANFLLEPRP